MSANRSSEVQRYGFVPLPERVNRQERAHARLDRRMPGTFSGTAQVTLVTEEPVFMGTGHKRLSDTGGRVIDSGVRIAGVPGVLGSSFKGVLRSRYEAMTRSCVLAGPGRNLVASPSDSRKEIKRARLSPTEASRDTLRPCSGKDDPMCPACALFGRMYFRARIAVMDLESQDLDDFTPASMPERFGPRLHHIGECRVVDDHGKPIHEVTRLSGRKFAVNQPPEDEPRRPFCVESIPAGIALVGYVRFTNVTPAELGGVLAALGHLPGSFIKIGGAKGHGFGRVRVTGIEWTLRDHLARAVKPDEPDWARAFVASDDYFEQGLEHLLALHGGAP